MPNGGELLVLIVLALIILGPDKLPEYAAKLGQFVRSARDMAEGARTQLRDEMGPGFDDVDWSALDPRQYDPRRIVRDALATPTSGAAGALDRGAPAETAAGRAANEAAIAGGGVPGAGAAGPRAPGPGARGRSFQIFDPALPIPWDVDAT